MDCVRSPPGSQRYVAPAPALWFTVKTALAPGQMVAGMTETTGIGSTTKSALLVTVLHGSLTSTLYIPASAAVTLGIIKEASLCPAINAPFFRQINLNGPPPVA